MKQLGKNWKQLHSLIYITGTLGILHFLWLVKADVRKPLLLGMVLITLLVLRLPYIEAKSIKKRITAGAHLCLQKSGADSAG